jgi:hypothetical protein
MWNTGYPKTNSGTCVAFQNLKLVNTYCDNNSNTTYYNFASGASEAATTMPLLGYLCETRHIYTASGTDMCYFPFTYQGKTYTSCSFESNSQLNNNGAPWCATEVRKQQSERGKREKERKRERV